MQKIDLTDQERRVLRHTLAGSSGTDEVCRNYFAAGKCHHDMPALTRLVSNGLMYVGELVPGQDSRYYHCTAQGARAVGLAVQGPNVRSEMPQTAAPQPE